MRDELMSAIGEGDLATVDRLLTVRADLGTIQDASGASAIQVAAYHGQPQIAVRLAEAAEAIDFTEAVVLGEMDEVARRITGGEDINGRSRDGFPLLGLAAFFGHLPIVETLIAHGANVDQSAANAMAVAPLNSAAALRDKASRHAIVSALLTAGANPSPRQAGGWTPIHQAAAAGDEALVAVLIEAGADPGEAADDDRTPADMAEERGHSELASRLRAMATAADNAVGDP